MPLTALVTVPAILLSLAGTATTTPSAPQAPAPQSVTTVPLQFDADSDGRADWFYNSNITPSYVINTGAYGVDTVEIPTVGHTGQIRSTQSGECLLYRTLDANEQLDAHGSTTWGQCDTVGRFTSSTFTQQSDGTLRTADNPKFGISLSDDTFSDGEARLIETTAHPLSIAR